MTDLSHRNDKFFTVHNTFSKIAQTALMQSATRVRRPRTVRVSWSLHFFNRAAASKMRPINSSRISTFLFWTPLFIKPHKQKCNQFRSGDPNSIISIPFLTMAYTITSQNTYLSSWITLYIAISWNVCSSSCCYRLRLKTCSIKTENVI